MNWEALGAIGQIIGALAVVVSLLYLAIQIRVSTQVLRRTATSDAAKAFRELSQIILPDRELNLIWRAGVEGIDRLDADQRTRFATFMFAFFKMFEDMHYQYAVGLMDADVWKGWENLGATYLAAPGARQYWEGRREAFSERFQAWVESLPRRSSLKRMDELVRQFDEPAVRSGHGVADESLSGSTARFPSSAKEPEHVSPRQAADG